MDKAGEKESKNKEGNSMTQWETKIEAKRETRPVTSCETKVGGKFGDIA